MSLDNLEYISIDKQTTDFPLHYHETFCISLIRDGIERIDFGDQSFFSEKGSISITNPYEIHSNPLIDTSTSLKFDTLYLSDDLMKYLLDGKSIRFVNRKINDEKSNQLFIALKNAMDTNNYERVEVLLRQFVNRLQFFSQENETEYTEEHLNDFDEINGYIENNLYDKFSLDELSRIANINKYGFIKKFKASTGITPMNYILMKKVFSSKKLINPNSELTEIAYQYNFTDMAHFSRTFKRYVGISPKKYQSKLS